MKKNYKYLNYKNPFFVSAILLVIFFHGFSQEKNILKVHYNGSNLTQIIQEKIDEKFAENARGRKNEMNFLSSFKSKFILTVNVTNNQSLFEYVEGWVDHSLVNDDPLSEENEKRYLPHTTIKDKNMVNSFMYFFSEGYKFKFHPSDLEWKITSENKEIAGFLCTKAILKNCPFKATVWFTKKIKIKEGPYIYKNLPGLVLSAESVFLRLDATKVEYMRDKTLSKKIKSIKKEKFNNKKVIYFKDFNKIHKKKINIILNSPL